ncbi:hypothetical protein BWI97_23090 [Siphonobacter sp. BAB-5405]|uniref:hypothetical protein n=1 Tax=Siphonobacter sp. BAB-5405 TaxID=1864825 RepID=UPI000C80D7C0|nr:hypothetical protein [Siphonobacter sp. BAB-5405]PMD90375.1 hypothetical protein BWI97_23090 [Siphonobacter sp. BAB-5405]
MKINYLFALAVAGLLTACQKEEVTPETQTVQAPKQTPADPLTTPWQKTLVEPQDIIYLKSPLPRPIIERPIIIYPGPIRTLPVQPITVY